MTLARLQRVTKPLVLFTLVSFALTACLVYIKDFGVVDPEKFHTPVGVAVDSQGNFYVSDVGNSVVKKFNAAGEQLLAFGGNGDADGQLDVPMDITIANDEIYVPELGNDRVSVFDTEGNFLRTIGEGVLGHVRSVAVAPNGDTYVANEFAHTIVKFDAAGNKVVEFGGFGVAEGQMQFPNSVGFGNGKLYVADRGNHRIQVFSPAGEFEAAYGVYGTGAGEYEFNTPRGVTVASDGKVWVSDTLNNRLKVFNADMSYVTTLGNAYVFFAPNGVAFSAEGDIYVVDAGNHQLKKFAAADFSLLLAVGGLHFGEGEFNFTDGIAYTGEEVYIVDSFNHRVQVFDTSGNFLRMFGGFGFGEAGMWFPRGIDVSADGSKVYVADMSNHQVKVFDPQGNLLAAVGAQGFGPGQFFYPHDVEIDSQGNIYVAELGGSRVQKFDADFNFIQQIGSYGFGPDQMFQAKQMSFDSQDNLYVTDYGNHRVQKYASDGTHLGSIGAGYGNGDGQLIWPEGLVVTADDEVIVGDANMRLNIFDADGNFVAIEGQLGAGKTDVFFPQALENGPYGTVLVANSLLNIVKQMYIE